MQDVWGTNEINRWHIQSTEKEVILHKINQSKIGSSMPQIAEEITNFFMLMIRE